MVNVLAECARMFRFSMPKYMESAPALMAAANDSREPTGAMISKSFLVMVWGFVCKDTPFSRHTGDAVVFFAFLRSLWAFFAVSLKRVPTFAFAKVRIRFGKAK